MSTLQVENLIGPTSGSNANKVIIPSGQTLDASNGFVAPAGSVIQTVNTTTTGTFSTNSTSMQTVLSCNITPKFSTSKVLININAMLYKSASGTASTGASFLTIYRDGSAIPEAYFPQDSGTSTAHAYAWWFTAATENIYHMSRSFVNAPSTSSQTTYSFLMKTGAGQTTSCYTGVQLILQEIAQ